MLEGIVPGVLVVPTLTKQPASNPVDQLGNPLHLISDSASVGLGTISLLVAYLPSFLLPAKLRWVSLLMKLGKDFHGFP